MDDPTRGEAPNSAFPRATQSHRWESTIENLTFLRAVRWIATLEIAVCLVGAALERLVNPAEFPTYAKALWFSVVTVGTVGYGDYVPSNSSGKTVAVGMIIAAVAFFPLLASAIISVLINKQQRLLQAGQREMFTQEIAAVKQSLERIERRLEGRTGSGE